MAQAHMLFSTPVISDQLADSELLNAELERMILEQRAKDPAGMKRTNAGGWHSDMNLLSWAAAPINPVVNRIVALADAATVDSQLLPGQRRGWMLEAWANVNPPGASNRAHSHGGCFWSAVYYVRIDPGEGGELVLHDPRLPALDMHAPALRFRNSGGEQRASLKPEAGNIVIFPSWLSHSVESWSGEGLRISIAINLSARIAAGAGS